MYSKSLLLCSKLDSCISGSFPFAERLVAGPSIGSAGLFWTAFGFSEVRGKELIEVEMEVEATAEVEVMMMVGVLLLRVVFFIVLVVIAYSMNGQV